MALHQHYLNESFKNKWENIEFPKSGLDRVKLVELLKRQNKDASEKVKQNIDLLENESTFAVVTGQQMGLMGGPLYTIYKTLNTILICNELNERYDDKQFVPILWMEGEDADFDEVSYVHYMKENQIRTFQYDDNGSKAIGPRILNLDINQLSFTLGMEQPFESERRWVDAFYLYFKPVLDEFGIIAFHSNEEDVYAACLPFWSTIIDHHQEIKQLIINQSDSLKKIDKLQVDFTEDETFLFQHGEHSRIKLKSINDVDPELNLSPNVLLRPLYQDYIFPTVVYVAGNAEISYQMQIETAYSVFSRKSPVLFPRTHHIILNPKMKRLMERYDFQGDIIQDNFDQWAEQILKTELNDRIDRQIDEFRSQLKRFIDNLHQLNFTDEATQKTLLEGFTVRHNKILNQLQKKMNNLVKRKDSEKLNHIEYLRLLLFPKNSLQERFYPLFQFDPNVLSFSEQVIQHMDIHNFDFQVIEIK